MELEAITLIKKEQERRANKVARTKLNFRIHRNIIRMEDLMGENVFPCDFYLTSFYAMITENASVKLWPIILPSDKNVMVRLMNRKLNEEQKDEYKDGIEAIKMWYIDKSINYEGENSKELMDSVCTVLRICLMEWMSLVVVHSPYYKINIEDFDSLWVGIDEGRLSFHFGQRPRCIKIWDNVKVVRNED